MLRHKWYIPTIALLLVIILGGGSIYWRFNGNTRPWNVYSELHSVHGESGEGTFGVVFVVPPVVRLSSETEASEALKTTIIVDKTTTSFRWTNGGKSANADGKLHVHAFGRISKKEAERLGLKWTPFSSWQLW